MSQLIDNLNSIDSIKSGIKSAIEAKGVDMTGLSFADYPGAISSIQTGGTYGQLYVTENGTYYPDGSEEEAFDEVVVLVEPSLQSKTVSVNGTVTPDQGYYGLSAVEVDVQPELQNKTVVVNGEYVADQGYYGLGTVTVSVPSPQFVTESLSVSVNGTYAPGQGVDGFSQVVVDVPQSVTVGIPEKEYTENTVIISNLNNSASYVASSVFISNSYLQTVNLPNCSSIGHSAFCNCSSLSQVSLPVCEYIGNTAFSGCALQSIYLPECSSVGTETFRYCRSLSQINLPKLKRTTQAMFDNCTVLTYVSIPMCGYLDKNTFNTCPSLSQVSLPVCSYIGQYAFYGCTLLSTITLEYSSVCNIYNSGVFLDTQLNSIYVPSSLVDAYKSNVNWSWFESKIFPIPE